MSETETLAHAIQRADTFARDIGQPVALYDDPGYGWTAMPADNHERFTARNPQVRLIGVFAAPGKPVRE